MIKENLKPTSKITNFIKANDSHGILRIIISIYDEPIISASEIDIFTVVDIKEEKGGEYIPYGNKLFTSQFNEEDIKKAFAAIKENPQNFKSK